MKRKGYTVTYTSSANEYYKWAKHHPIAFIERYTGIKLKWYQKIFLLYIHFKRKRKHSNIEKVIERYISHNK